MPSASLRQVHHLAIKGDKKFVVKIQQYRKELLEVDLGHIAVLADAIDVFDKNNQQDRLSVYEGNKWSVYGAIKIIVPNRSVDMDSRWPGIKGRCRSSFSCALVLKTTTTTTRKTSCHVLFSFSGVCFVINGTRESTFVTTQNQDVNRNKEVWPGKNDGEAQRRCFGIVIGPTRSDGRGWFFDDNRKNKDPSLQKNTHKHKNNVYET